MTHTYRDIRHTHVETHDTPVCEKMYLSGYGVATISRLLKIIGLFCKRALEQRRHSAKETYNFKEPTNHIRHTCMREYILKERCDTHIQRHTTHTYRDTWHTWMRKHLRVKTCDTHIQRHMTHIHEKTSACKDMWHTHIETHDTHTWENIYSKRLATRALHGQ